MDICWKHSSTSYKALGRKKFPLNKHKKAINTTITAKVHPSLGPGVQRSQKRQHYMFKVQKGIQRAKQQPTTIPSTLGSKERLITVNTRRMVGLWTSPNKQQSK